MHSTTPCVSLCLPSASHTPRAPSPRSVAFSRSEPLCHRRGLLTFPFDNIFIPLLFSRPRCFHCNLINITTRYTRLSGIPRERTFPSRRLPTEILLRLLFYPLHCVAEWLFLCGPRDSIPRQEPEMISPPGRASAALAETFPCSFCSRVHPSASLLPLPRSLSFMSCRKVSFYNHVNSV